MAKDFDPRCHIGEVHGIYTIVDMLEEKDKYGHWIYKCICNECGFEKFSHYGAINGANSITTTCKHLRANGMPIIYDKRRWNNKRIGQIFRSMVVRCYCKTDRNYQWYGAKGIEVCNEWLNDPMSFEKWALNSGYADDLTIDRIESDGNYCPENCRWISVEENSRRAGIVTWIEIDGKNLTGRQWADYFKIGTNVINTAIRNYGLDKTKELIAEMLKNHPSTKNRKANQSWFDVYGIQV